MDYKDYYEMLGVPPNAEKKVNQKTYRQLARRFHPDLNPCNKEAKDKFKTINEAYQVLSDEKSPRSMMSCGLNTSNGSRKVVTNRISTGKANRLNLTRGAHVQYAAPEDMEDLFGSETPYSNFFTSIFGQARRSSKGKCQTTLPGPCRGRKIDVYRNL
jgi:curved DNA-binding protein